ncbi:MAG: GNAT family N-acetyltransferase [Burkholderiales bacterium]|nr:GNAT family N-acetyltransferase [Anaerolineae bacterium]
MSNVTIKPISAAETRPMRQRILRPHQTVEQLNYPGDDDVDALHIGAFIDDTLVGVASFSRQPPPRQDMPDAAETAWRLQGMATTPEVRGTGCGGMLLQAGIRHVAQNGGTWLWCNGRVNVVGFYQRYGFARLGQPYERPGTGPHYFLWRMVTPEDAKI